MGWGCLKLYWEGFKGSWKHLRGSWKSLRGKQENRWVTELGGPCREPQRTFRWSGRKTEPTLLNRHCRLPKKQLKQNKNQWLLTFTFFPVTDVSTPTPQTPLIQAAGSGTKASDKKSARRPEIDYIRVGLTWGILLYHVIFIYLPAQFYIHDPFYEYANNTVGGTDVNDQ